MAGQGAQPLTTRHEPARAARRRQTPDAPRRTGARGRAMKKQGMQNYVKTGQGGFTLIELMIVVA
ncbi:prepilin-type N-terminal cleavage/methylation domain-containing protein, partial [Halomonas sp.]|uniref:prepilin-type N-terminal cleavage/methylation domain-containing protein n=1 Tax=Halomonas sp. TaxID=1486246 RepID=UPI003569EDA1